MKANTERIPGKNFRSFNGKPLFRWILDTLLSIEAIDCVVINTDARRILADNGLVESERVRIRDRRPDICGNMVSMNLIIEDDVASIPADVYVMTHTTNPLVNATTIESAIREFQAALAAGTADSLFTVDRVQTRFYRSDASPVNHDPNDLIRTQDLEPWFEENSNLYLFTRSSFDATHSRIGHRPMLLENSRFESIDIDDEDDWGLAVAAAQYLESKRSRR